MLSYIRKKIFGQSQPKGLILMYHQVCERKSDPWSLAVQPENFASQMRLLHKHYNVVSVEELSWSVLRRKISHNMIAITFDDGFADNYHHAAPILEWYKLPSSFYVPTHASSNEVVYWWEALEAIILHTMRLPERLMMRLNNVDLTFRFTEHHYLTPVLKKEIKSWRSGQASSNERIILYTKLWNLIQPLPHVLQQKAIEALAQWATSDYKSMSARVMNISEIKKLADNNLFTIGGHTVHHAMLGAQDESTQSFEIRESKRTLEQWLIRSVAGFAYPYGNYNEITKSIIASSGYRYAVSTESAAVTAKHDVYALPRVQINDWDASRFQQVIHSYLN